MYRLKMKFTNYWIIVSEFVAIVVHRRGEVVCRPVTGMPVHS